MSTLEAMKKEHADAEAEEKEKKDEQEQGPDEVTYLFCITLAYPLKCPFFLFDPPF